jgi:hypothetical protein
MDTRHQLRSARATRSLYMLSDRVVSVVPLESWLGVLVAPWLMESWLVLVAPWLEVAEVPGCGSL